MRLKSNAGLPRTNPNWQKIPHAGVRHTYDRVLPSAPKEPFVTLLSPSQCHTAFGMMPHTLALVDYSPVCRPRTLPPPQQGHLGLDFGGEMHTKHQAFPHEQEVQSLDSLHSHTSWSNNSPLNVKKTQQEGGGGGEEKKKSKSVYPSCIKGKKR
jgi:hypothetical protein